MPGHVYRVTEVYGSSQTSIEDAVSNAVETASETIRNIVWVEITEMRASVENNKVGYYQVGCKLGFKYEKH